MEDISRELEKEIAQAKPKPYKKKRSTRILIVDDFGQMRSGDHLKLFVRWLCLISLIGIAAAVVFYYLYSGVSTRVKDMEKNLALAQQQVKDLTDEKEVLMAKVVMLGENPSTIPEIFNDTPDMTDQITQTNDQGLPSETQTASIQENTYREIENKTANTTKHQETNGPSMSQDNNPSDVSDPSKPLRGINNIVAIEKFTVTKDGTNGDLLVRFDIRNISNELGEVSGRVFTILKPENGYQNQWLVVPSAPLKAGVPSEYKKGQYFSIAHFKPVNFRIKNTVGPDFFKTASIYIFNSQEELIFEELIEISEESQVE